MNMRDLLRKWLESCKSLDEPVLVRIIYRNDMDDLVESTGMATVVRIHSQGFLCIEALDIVKVEGV